MFCRQPNFILWVIAIWLVAEVCCRPIASAQQETSAAKLSTGGSGLIQDVRIGFNSQLKIGHWIPVRVRVNSSQAATVDRLELVSTDSDSVPVINRWRARADEHGWLTGYVCVGRLSGDLTVRLLDAQGQVLDQREWPRLQASEIQLIPATVQLALSIGADVDLAKSLPMNSVNTSNWKVVHLRKPIRCRRIAVATTAST